MDGDKFSFKLETNIEGSTDTDLIGALTQVLNSLESGMNEGMGQNQNASYYFKVKEYDKLTMDWI